MALEFLSCKWDRKTEEKAETGIKGLHVPQSTILIPTNQVGHPPPNHHALRWAWLSLLSSPFSRLLLASVHLPFCSRFNLYSWGLKRTTPPEKTWKIRWCDDTNDNEMTTVNEYSVRQTIQQATSRKQKQTRDVTSLKHNPWMTSSKSLAAFTTVTNLTDTMMSIPVITPLWLMRHIYRVLLLLSLLFYLFWNWRKFSSDEYDMAVTATA